MADDSAREAGPPWAKGGAIALGLHVAVIGATLVTLKAPTALLPAAAPFQVTMTPALPTDIPAGVVQDEATPEPAKPEADQPVLPPPESIADAAIKLPKATERPTTPAPQQPAEVAAATTTRPPSAPVAPAAPAPPADAAASGAASDAWQERLLAQLERNKRYPAKARYFRQQDTVLVQFTMSRAGRVLSSRIVRSQGFADIDAEVLALLKRAQPLIAPPPDVPGDPLTRTVAIQFYLS